MPEYLLRPATEADAPEVGALVQAAYGHYIERIGMTPGPMTEDYAEVIAHKQVTVAIHDSAIAGVLVLDAHDGGFYIENIAVHPAHQGQGFGRVLLEFAEAEARRAGFDAITLYTHEKMTENIALYSKFGYVEFGRRSLGDFSLVYMRKEIAGRDVT